MFISAILWITGISGLQRTERFVFEPANFYLPTFGSPVRDHRNSATTTETEVRLL